MGLSVMSKVALCVCPPVALATTVAAVPPVKRAVHHATAKPRVARTAEARTVRAADRRTDVPCLPVAPVGIPLVTPPAPLVTFADPGITDLPSVPPVVNGPGVGPGPIPGAFPPIVPPIGGPIPTPTPTPEPTPTPTPTPTPEAPIPEPATWALMIGGFAMAGMAFRRRRLVASRVGVNGRTVARTGGLGMGSFFSSGVGAAGDAVGTVAAAPTLAATVGKVALCVCPPAMMVGAAVTVPPVRNAVHAATAPVINRAAFPPTVTLVPCPVVVITSAETAPTGFGSEGRVALTSGSNGASAIG